MLSGNAKGGSGGGGGGGAVTVADGADVVNGAVADAAVTGDNAGTHAAKLRGINKILADVWNSVLHVFNVALQAATSGGCSGYHVVALGTNNADVVKNAAGQVYSVHGYCAILTYPVYVKLYNKASAPNPAADTPVFTIALQATLPRDVVIPVGRAFSTGIAIAIVKGISDTDNTVLAAGDCVVDVNFK